MVSRRRKNVGKIKLQSPRDVILHDLMNEYGRTGGFKDDDSRCNGKGLVKVGGVWVGGSGIITVGEGLPGLESERKLGVEQVERRQVQLATDVLRDEDVCAHRKFV